MPFAEVHDGFAAVWMDGWMGEWTGMYCRDGGSVNAFLPGGWAEALPGWLGVRVLCYARLEVGFNDNNNNNTRDILLISGGLVVGDPVSEIRFTK